MNTLGCLCSCFGRPYSSKSDDESLTRPEKLSRVISEASSGGTLMDDEGANYQQQLWDMALQLKVLQFKQKNVDVGLEFHDTSTPETFIQSLSVAYAEHGCSQRMQRVRQVFMLIEPFITTINTMASSHLVSAMLLGSLTLVYQSVLRFSHLFEDTSQMLSELARGLPRFHIYAEIFHTPRLHLALRTIYDGFLVFCFQMIEVLQAKVCFAVLRGRWLSLSSEFKQTKEWLNTATSEFEKEARLADVQEQLRRHGELMARIGGTQAAKADDYIDPVTNINLPRNEKFAGRDDVLMQLHSQLTASFQGEISERIRCSTVVCAVGGMGKTETALEYAYRYMHCYTHVFWIRAQTPETLISSFLDTAAKLHLEVPGADSDKKVQAVIDWFQVTTSPWLLIFDNAEGAALIKKFWPSGNRGAIIVTTQNPHLAHLTRSKIHLQPMSPNEGSVLIQNFLNRGRSEQEAAQLLSTTLGGLPLAIAHFAGFVARSQCPLDQICDSLNNRMKSSKVWRMENTELPVAYEHTLSTVWDMAFKRLSPDSSKLLEFLAFLNADQVPVDMFVGPKDATTASTEGWQYWDAERFDAALAILLERHLVERYIIPAGHFLRTHRALQRCILQRLDENLNKRQAVFDEVVSIVRKAFPEANIITRGDVSKYEQSGRYLPQVTSIHTAYVQSQPPMDPSLSFAHVLSDVGYYGVNDAVQAAVLVMLETAESMCTALLDKDPEGVRPILGNILGPMQVLLNCTGVAGRKRALELSGRCIAIRQEQLGDTPRDQWTKLDLVNFGRAYNDKGVSLCQLNRIDEAKPWFASALDFYQSAGTEETLKSRLGHIYSFKQLPLASDQQSEETRQLADRSVKLIGEAVGRSSPLYLQTKFLAAMTRFTTGFVEEALEMHSEIFKDRLIRHGKSHHLTLGSQYALAVCHQNVGDLENAEKTLRENVEDGFLSLAWREEDIVRSKFRLSIVLRAQDKVEEAVAVHDEIADHLERLRAAAPKSDAAEPPPKFTDQDDMKLLDFEVSFFHGRTAGKWSNGKYW